MSKKYLNKSTFFLRFSLHLQNKYLLLHHQNVIELWCNGNTTDSGPVILGSNPGSSTKPLLFRSGFLFPCNSRNPSNAPSYRRAWRIPATRRNRLIARTLPRHDAARHGANLPRTFSPPSATLRRRLTCTIYKKADASRPGGTPPPSERCTARTRLHLQTRLQSGAFCTRCRKKVPEMNFFILKSAGLTFFCYI